MIKKTVNKISGSKLFSEDFPDENLNQFACHLNENTIATKNAELIKIVKISNISANDDEELYNVRDAVLAAINEYLPQERFAVWINIINKENKVKIETSDDVDIKVLKYADQKLNELYKFDSYFSTELYITFVAACKNISARKIGGFFESLSSSHIKSVYTEQLKKTNHELDKFIGHFMDGVREYHPELLTVKIDDETGYYRSEMIEFLATIMNFDDEKYFLTTNSISDDLSNKKIDFHKSYFTVEHKDRKVYSAILSIKEYGELSLFQIREIFKLSLPFIITEAVIPIDRELGVSRFRKQYHFLELSKSKYLAELMNIPDITNEKTRFAETQTIINVFADSKEDLDKRLKDISVAFHKLGIIIILEDIFLEKCFWSQLPANFAFLQRRKTVALSSIFGFVAQNGISTGVIQGSKWGDPIFAFKNVLNIPYFFSMDNSNIEIIGHAGNQSNLRDFVMNLIVLNSLKLDGVRIFGFDIDRKSEIFTKSVNGKYYSILSNNEDGLLKLNPFLLKDTLENKQFIFEWFCSLFDIKKRKISKEEAFEIKKAIDFMYSQVAQENRGMSGFMKILSKNQLASGMMDALSIWFGDGKLSKIFDNRDAVTEIDFGDNVIYFNFNQILKYPEVMKPVLSYILYKISQNISATNKNILVISDFYRIFGDVISAKKLDEIIKDLNKKNTSMIFSYGNNVNDINEEILKTITSNVKNQIITNIKNLNSKVIEMFEFGKNILKIMGKIGANEKYFMIINENESVVIEFDIKDFARNLSKILSPDDDAIGDRYEIIDIITNQSLKNLDDSLSNFSI